MPSRRDDEDPEPTDRGGRDSGDDEGDDGSDEALLDVPSRHHRPSPHPTRAGDVECLSCGEPFESWDRRNNRICPRCRSRQ